MSGSSGASEERTESSVERLREWVLLDGSRLVVAGITAGALLAISLAVSVSPLSPLGSHQPLYYAFSGLIGGNLTIITVVVSINQLLLSRELRTPRELRSEMDGITDYRRDITESAGQSAPVEPLGFLKLLVETTRQAAQRLGGLSRSEVDDDAAEEIDCVVTEVTDNADSVLDLLEDSGVSTFEVLATTLNTNYAEEINHLRGIEFRHGDGLPEDVRDAVGELAHLLESIDVARQYFKSVYLQQELASLSRLLFYAGLPSVAVVALSLLVFTDPNGTAISDAATTVLVPVVITVGLFPLTVLFSYVLRSATVARRTAAIIPFTTPAQEQ